MLRKTIVSMNNNYIEHQRDVYSVLDLIGDVGGLYDGLSSIIQGFLSLIGLLGYSPISAYLFKVASNDTSGVFDHLGNT